MEKYQPINKSDLLAVITTERKNLINLISSLSNEKKAKPGVEVEWSIKDILAHIAAWERIAIDIIQLAHSGEPLKPTISKIFEDVDYFNDQVYQQNKELPIKKVQVEFEASHDDFIALIKTLDEEFIFSQLPFDGTEDHTIQYIISANTHWHYLEHTASISNWITTHN